MRVMMPTTSKLRSIQARARIRLENRGGVRPLAPPHGTRVPGCATILRRFVQSLLTVVIAASENSSITTQEGAARRALRPQPSWPAPWPVEIREEMERLVRHEQARLATGSPRKPNLPGNRGHLGLD
jgi:hypothetical protein